MEKQAYIKKLLEKFYEGQTTLAEEAELQQFFCSEEVPDEWQAERELFSSLGEASGDVDVPADLDERIRMAVSREENRELRTRRINWFTLSGLAAGLAIILAVYFTVVQDRPVQYAETGTIEDPEVAYEQTLKVLSYVTDKWNTGTQELGKLQQVNKTMEAISPLQKISSGNRELRLLGNLEKAKEL